MITFLAILAILMSVLLTLLILPLKIKIIYHRENQNDYMAIELLFLWGKFPVRLEISSLEAGGNFFIPLLKIKGKLTSKIKRPVAQQKKSINVISILEILKRSFYYISIYKPALHFMTKKFKIKNFIWHTDLGFENAASTGIATGMLWTLKGLCTSILYRFTGIPENYPDIAIKPVYNCNVLDTKLNCILEVRPGHIIIGSLFIVKLMLFNSKHFSNNMRNHAYSN